MHLPFVKTMCSSEKIFVRHEGGDAHVLPLTDAVVELPDARHPRPTADRIVLDIVLGSVDELDVGDFIFAARSSA